MNPTHFNEKKLSEQIVEFIDLTDQNLEEISLSEFGGIQGARRGGFGGFGGRGGFGGFGGRGGFGGFGSCSCFEVCVSSNAFSGGSCEDFGW